MSSVGLLLHSLQHGLRLLAAPHEDDAFDRVVVLLKPNSPSRGSMADLHLADIADADRHAFVGADDDVLDVLGIADQADAAHVIELAALRVETAAGVGIVVRQRLHHLRHGQVVAVKPRGIEQHLVLHGGAAEAGIVRHAGHGLIGALDHPVLDGL